ncbi:MAG: hypothetical protein SPI74_00500 [Eubacterium sp.]|nr:hypothetical protein [Eubacterium sp.]
MNKYFSLENRKKLKFLLGEGFSITLIQKKLSITRTSMYTELKKGLTEDEYTNRQYVKYDYIRAIEKDVEKYIGAESLKELKERYNA